MQEDMGNKPLTVHPTDQIILPGSYNSFEIKNMGNMTNCVIEYAETTNFQQKKIKIPILFYNYKHETEKTNLYTIYFHGNGENILQQEYFYTELTQYFKTNIVSMEYSGYSLYQDHIIDAEQIKQDAVTTFDYLVKVKGVQPKNILVLGRSIGSGPACYLGSQRQCAGIIIFAGFSRIVTWLKEKKFKEEQITERFDNLSCIKDFKIPACIIHGEPDKIINISHARILEEELKKHSLPVQSFFHNDMDHNYFSLEQVSDDIYKFLKEFKIIE